MSQTAQHAPPGQELSLRALLQEMIQRGASDLHLTVGNPAKLRVDGDVSVAVQVEVHAASAAAKAKIEAAGGSVQLVAP